ncbi:MAG: putative 4-hydroxybenzoate polyprenyltransferase [Bacteroidetes bacterium]|nr:putative 4-hydroxybenzoate polyprenyltransferase [Bacteroidota bacterium]MCL5025868.1 putative 4-hydroxybenzoate polyprenyltransferase [Chloroflexota bacterium]
MDLVRAVGRAPIKIRVTLEAVKFEHTIFALPFAYLGMVLAAGGLPTWHQFAWITVAMFGGRTLAMASNRLIDQEMDRRNPRTAGRPLQRGLLSARDLLLLSIAAAAVYFFAAWQLNLLCLLLSPLGAILLVGYSYAKRFTWTTHYILGAADGIAPVGAWFAVTGTLAWEPIVLGTAVALWIAGFDILYACQDIDFDRTHSVYAIPARFGIARALDISLLTHALTAAVMLIFGILVGLGPLYFVGWLIMSALLTYEHRLVRPDDLSQLNVAFFNLNGYIAVAVFVFAFGGLVWR